MKKAVRRNIRKKGGNQILEKVSFTVIIIIIVTSFPFNFCLFLVFFYLKKTMLTSRLIPRRLLSTTAILRSSKVVGIDLGTTNSVVAYIRDSNNRKSATIIENAEGNRTTPSIVSFSVNSATGKVEQTLVGMKAKRQQALNPQNTFFATKRLIGRSFEDEEVQQDLKVLPFKIARSQPSRGSNEGLYLQLTNGELKAPSDISSMILQYLKGAAEDYLNEEVKSAVITVPAYFDDAQRQATKDAGKKAGLNVLRVVNEPTAAALSFGLDESLGASGDEQKAKKGLIAVYDLGGGTFDISILDIEDGVFEVRSTNGDTHLGGEDFDNVLVNYFINCFVEANPEVSRDAITSDRQIMQRIKDAAERAKIELSDTKETEVDIPFLYENRHLQLKLTESQLNEMTLHLIKKTIAPVKKALKDADIEPEDIDEVILVGGMTRMPKVRSEVQKLFNKVPNTSVNPDETVALGAAIQGGILSGEIKNVLLLDVTPLSLGIETFGGAFSPLIPRNTTIPVRSTEVFSTGVDNQTGVQIQVYQGERGLVRNNKLIGKFDLTGIPPMPKGTPQILVTFDIDADGILNISAAEKSSGIEKSIRVVANQGISEEEVQKMVEEAAENREHDNMIRRRLELLAKADIMVSDTLTLFEQHKQLISKDEKYPEILEELKSLGSTIKQLRENEEDTSVDINDVKRQTDALQRKSFELFRRASKAAAAAATEPSQEQQE